MLWHYEIKSNPLLPLTRKIHHMSRVQREAIIKRWFAHQRTGLDYQGVIDRTLEVLNRRAA
jgi:hypothetical protein